MSFNQTDLIRDSVFPIVEVEDAPDGSAKFLGLLGTGFLIGSRDGL